MTEEKKEESVVPVSLLNRQHFSDRLTPGGQGAIIHAEDEASIQAAIQEFNRLHGPGPQAPTRGQ